MTFSGVCEALPLLLVSPGSSAAVSERLARVAPVVAAQLSRVPLGPLEPLQQPDRALADLADGAGPSPGLAWLGLDPGQTLADGRSWAEALGAWRQPTLLLLEAAQLDGGAAAASTALLRQHRVLLLGLLQWGEPWQGQLRRREGLPWLGALGPDGSLSDGFGDECSDGFDLRLVLARQGAALRAGTPAPPGGVPG
jgi:hypothetical protein